jgi:quercetin dioxygenase-like cupin family protein
MLLKLGSITAIACLAVATVWAQEPTKVEPTHYRLDFENEHVQVISVHYGPHEKSALHGHPGGVVVSLTEAHLRFTDQNGKIQEVYSKPGEARWFPPFKHRVENLGDTPYNAVYIGMKGKNNFASSDGTMDQQHKAEINRMVAEAFSRIGN